MSKSGSRELYGLQSNHDLNSSTHVKTSQVAGCCDGSLPMCLEQGDLRIGDGDSARSDFARRSGDLFVPGVSLSISAGYHGKTEPMFSGIVLSQRVVVRRGSLWLEVECRDRRL